MFRRRREPTGYRRFVRDRVIVHTKDRLSFRGFVVHDDAATIVLDHVERLDHRAGRQQLEAVAISIAGRLSIDTVNVSHVQLLGPVADEPAIAAPIGEAAGDVVRPVVLEPVEARA